VGAEKIRAFRMSCDGCGHPQVVMDPTEIVGYNGVILEPTGDGRRAKRIKFFAHQVECLPAAVTNAVERAHAEQAAAEAAEAERAAAEGAAPPAEPVPA
jgi:hypothetical protein